MPVNFKELDSYQSSIFEQEPVKKHHQGPARTHFRPINATSFSSSGCNFSLDVPSTGTIIDREKLKAMMDEFEEEMKLTIKPDSIK